MSFARQTLRCLLAASLVVVGCRRVEPIVEYTVETVESVDVTPAGGPPAEAKPSQTIGAMLAVDGMGWFFKLTGDPKLVAPQREAFVEFVKGLTFASGEPKWTLPAGWTARPASGLRFATIEVSTNTGSPLELTVIPLPQGDATPEEFVLSNVNRWRDQVGLPSLDAAELAKETETFKVGDFDCTLVDVVGTSQGGGMGGAPFAPFASGSAGSGGESSTQGPAPGDQPISPAPSGTEPGAGGGLTYDKPAGWTAGQQNQFSKLAFNVASGDQTAQITVTELGPAAGDVTANVNRWRGQVGLDPTTEIPESALIPITTLGTEGKLVLLIGPEPPGPGSLGRKAMLGVIAPTPDRVWFVKLMGDHDLVLKERDNFETFTKSLQTK